MKIYSLFDQYRENITSLNILYVSNTENSLFDDHTDEYSVYPIFNFGRLPTMNDYQLIIEIMIVEIKNDSDITDSKIQIQLNANIEHVDSRLNTTEYDNLPEEDRNFVLKIYNDFFYHFKINEVSETERQSFSPVSTLTVYLKNENFLKYIKEIISFKITKEHDFSYEETMTFTSDVDFLYHYFKNNEVIHSFLDSTNDKNEVKDLIALNFFH